MTTIARKISSFTKQEIRDLFKISYAAIRMPALEIRKARTAQEHGRILLVIPRRVGNAVKRNKLKRRLKSIFFEEQLYTKGTDLIVLAKSPDATQYTFQELKVFLTQAIESA